MDKGNRYRLGIIGAGTIAEFRTVPAAINTGLFDMIGAYDADPQRSDHFYQTFAIPQMSSIEALYVQKPDAVYIATPNNAHVSYAIQAIKQGVAVLLEKPCADTFEAATELLLASEQAKSPILLGYMHMWNRHNQAAEKLIRDNRIGDIRSYTASFGFLNTELDGWRRLRNESGCGALADLGIYAISTALNLFGEMPISCNARAYPAGDARLSVGYLSGRLNFPGNRWMQISTSFLSDSCHYTVVGSQGAIHVEGSWAQSGEGQIVLCHGDNVSQLTEEIVNPYEEEIKCLKRCLDGEPVPASISLRRAVDDVKIMSALDRSAAEDGREIMI